MLAVADFPLDGRERFIPSPFRIALGRTWSPAYSPSTLIERCGPVVFEWPRFRRVIETLPQFEGRKDFFGQWARSELRAIEAAKAGTPLKLRPGDPIRDVLQAGVDDWLLGAFEHLTVNRGLSPKDAYDELARVRRSTASAIAMKFSRLRDATGTRRRRLVERTRRILRRKKI